MKAILRNYRQSPRKVALAAGLIRGKTVSNALAQLTFATKRASSPVIKLIQSALANAKSAGVANPEELIVKEIRVDQGRTLKRMMPRARGTGARILKRSSHILLVLGEAKPSKKASKIAKEAVAVENALEAKTSHKAKTTKTKATAN